jgi:hypothetical protein
LDGSLILLLRCPEPHLRNILIFGYNSICKDSSCEISRHQRGVVPPLIQILYYFSGEKEGSGIYEGTSERKVKRNKSLWIKND